MRVRFSLVLSAALLLSNVVGVAAAPKAPTMMAPVQVARQSQFGNILITPHKQALYYFTPEKDGKIHCTGSCLKAWPPLLVMGNAMVPAHIKGVMGMFGTIVRPDKGHQITFNGKPLYTYSGDKAPLQVLCNGVDGWYVVKVM